MTSVQAIGVGRVKKITELTSKNGKPYLAIACEMSPKSFGGKTMSDRFEVHVYGESGAEVQDGDWISATGSARAATNEWQGKVYGKLIITGMVSIIACYDDDDTAAPVTQTPVQTAGPVKTLAQKTREPVNPMTRADDSDSEIPF